RETVRERARIDEKAGRDEKDRDEQRVADELQILLRRFLFHSRVERETGEKRPDDIRKLNDLRERARDSHDGDHHGEIRALVAFELLQNSAAGAAQAEQDRWDEYRDLDEQ